MYNPVELILKKRDNLVLQDDELSFIVNGYIQGSIPDYQMAAMLMAIFLRGMTSDEIASLTKVYIESGESITFPDNMHTVDKHSTGGVGDKITLVLAPIVASCGCYIPMISGRGLGHTGGTLDKLESIPGFSTNYSSSQFKDLVQKVGTAIIQQSPQIVPADKKIYALRDVVGTVESIPLITASIMCKKIAEGAQNLVIDLKTGTGAFMKSLDQAKDLATSLMNVGSLFNQKVSTIFTNMNSPIGYFCGNTLEVIECIDYLKGNENLELDTITRALASEMLILTGKAINKQQAYVLYDDAIGSGKALAKLQEIIINQKGDPRVIDDYSLFDQAKYQIPITSKETGYISSINTQRIGYLMIELGAGRKVLNSTLDYATGAFLPCKIGDYVEKSKSIGTLYMNNDTQKEYIASEVLKCYQFSKSIITKEPIILDSMLYRG